MTTAEQEHEKRPEERKSKMGPAPPRSSADGSTPGPYAYVGGAPHSSLTLSQRSRGLMVIGQQGARRGHCGMILAGVGDRDPIPITVVPPGPFSQTYSSHLDYAFADYGFDRSTTSFGCSRCTLCPHSLAPCALH